MKDRRKQPAVDNSLCKANELLADSVMYITASIKENFLPITVLVVRDIIIDITGGSFGLIIVCLISIAKDRFKVGVLKQ